MIKGLIVCQSSRTIGILAQSHSLIRRRTRAMLQCRGFVARRLFLLLYVVARTRCEHDDDIGLEGRPRTLTFDSYYRNPLYKPMRPVYVSEVDVVSYIPDMIVTLSDRLVVSPKSKPVIRGVYYRLRTGGLTWEEMDPERGNVLFEFSSDPQRLALLVNLTAMADVYENLGATGAPRYFDPRPNSTLNLLPSPPLSEQRAVFGPQIQRFRHDTAMRAQEATRARRSIDVMASKLYPTGSVRPTSVLDVGYDRVAPAFETQATHASPSSIIDFAVLLELTGPATQEVNKGKIQRLDLTIVPRVRRSRPTSVLCTPGANSATVSPGLADGLPFQKAAYVNPTHLSGMAYSSCQLEQDFNNVAAGSSPPPNAGRCQRPTGSVRAHGQHLSAWRTRLSSPDFAELHPEEAFWLRKRLDWTADALLDFVAAQLPRKQRLGAREARVRVAVAHGGEGKRGALHAIGVASSLFDLGVYNHSSWVGGSSGAAWFLASWYAAAKAENTALPSPSALFSALRKSVQRAALADEFDANEAVTDFFKGLPPFNSADGAFRSAQTARRTDRVFCDAELKLNGYNSLEGLQGLPSFFEYFTRAMAMQFLDPVAPRGVSYTLSGFATHPLLSDAAMPLPLFQLQEELEGDPPSRVANLWEATPFDVSTHADDLHASFPTDLLGSSATPTNAEVGAHRGLITQYMDTLPFLAGLSSHLLPRLRGEAWAGVMCGGEEDDSAACQAIQLNNPFRDFARLQNNTRDPGLFSREHVVFSDGGGPHSLPLWPFLTPARRADVVIVSDASGGRQTPSFGAPTRPGFFPPRAVEASGRDDGLITSLPGSTTPLPAGLVDRGASGVPDASGPAKPRQCALDRGGADCPAPVGYSLADNSSCCDLCKGPEADMGGCWPSDAPDAHPLFGLSALASGTQPPPPARAWGGPHAPAQPRVDLRVQQRGLYHRHRVHPALHRHVRGGGPPGAQGHAQLQHPAHHRAALPVQHRGQCRQQRGPLGARRPRPFLLPAAGQMPRVPVLCQGHTERQFHGE